MSENSQIKKCFISPLTVRKGDEPHRAATELELLFDLVFVIAIAIAALNLHHSIAEHHYLEGTVKFFMTFLMLWWPWVSFTWFANSFDNDDPPYRIAVLIMMFGVILIASGIPGFFDHLALELIVSGFVIIRLAQSYLWFRAGKDNPEYLITTNRNAWGQIILQVLWVLLAFTLERGTALFFAAFGLGFILELFVPYYASKAKTLPWHKHHIVERYGLLNIIVLGEVLLSAAIAMQSSFESGHFSYDMLLIAICAIVISFCLWWIYFCEEEQLISMKLNHVFSWGYGHFFIYAPAASIGAGFAALVDATKHHGHGDPVSALWAISISTSLYLFGLLIIRDRHILHKKSSLLLLCFALLIALTPLLNQNGLPAMTILLVIALTLRLKGIYKN